MWLNSGGSTSSLRYDLGKVYRISQLRILNYNEAGLSNRGVKDFNLYTSEFGSTWIQVGTGAYTLNQAPGNTSGDCGTTLALPGETEGRFLRMEILNNHGGDYTGLSEFRFDGLDKGHGGDIIPTAVVDKSSEFISGGDQRLAVATINGDNGSRWIYKQPDVSTAHQWLTDVGDWGTYESDGTTRAWIEYDLGVTKRLAALHVWNYNEGARATRGVNSFDILVKADSGSSFTNLGTFSLKRSDDKELTFAGSGTGGDNDQNDFSQIVAFPGSERVRFVRLNIRSNHGDATFVGLNEVQFLEAAAPPPAGTIVYIR